MESCMPTRGESKRTFFLPYLAYNANEWQFCLPWNWWSFKPIKTYFWPQNVFEVTLGPSLVFAAPEFRTCFFVLFLVATNSPFLQFWMFHLSQQEINEQKRDQIFVDNTIRSSTLVARRFAVRCAVTVSVCKTNHAKLTHVWRGSEAEVVCKRVLGNLLVADFFLRVLLPAGFHTRWDSRFFFQCPLWLCPKKFEDFACVSKRANMMVEI